MSRFVTNWSMTSTRWPRGGVVGVAYHWYDGRHLGITGFDISVGLIVKSFHFSYRNKVSHV